MLTVTKLLHEKEILHIIGTDFLCLQRLTVLCIFIQIDSQRFDRLIRRYENGSSASGGLRDRNIIDQKILCKLLRLCQTTRQPQILT